MVNSIPLVSIIMPAYNASLYIISSIESVINQKYSTWELLVIDDGSTDNTAALVSEVKDNRIRLIRKNNEGVAAARNTGISLVKGDYIAFLDSDDLWCSDKLFAQVKYLELHPNCIMVHSDYTSFVNTGVVIPNKQLEPFKINDIHDRLLIFNCISTLTVVVRSSAIKNVGGFDENLFGPEDWDLWIKLSRIGNIGYVDSPLAKYREHDGGISKDRSRQLEQEYRVIQKHAISYGAPLIKRKAKWFFYLKLCNHYVRQRFYFKAISTYLRMVTIYPFTLKNISYPFKKIVGS